MAAANAPPVRFAPAQAHVESRADGSFILRSPAPLAPYAPSVGVWLETWAQRTPERVLLAERDGDGWRTITYAKALATARTLGAALLERGLSAERPLAILSDNSVDHGLLALACQYAGTCAARTSRPATGSSPS